MDLWIVIQIGLIFFFVIVPIVVIGSLVWLKRVIDENRDLAKKELDFMTKGEVNGSMCDVCGEQLEKWFLFCPVCHKKLANKCPHCGKHLKIKWTKCPYCGENYGIEKETEEQSKQLSMPLDSQ